MSKFYTRLLPALALTALGVLSVIPSARAAVAVLPSAWATGAAIPVLNWQQRSDWTNVKTDVTPAAVGDGVHDDTAALQAGLDHLSRGYFGSKTLYLPAGTYRITKTLTLGQIYGAFIIGQGRTTRILWGSTQRLSMYVSNGACRAHYVGLTWDGAGKASVGVDHQSTTFYESLIRHQDEAFVNFLDAGIRIGYRQVVPTSEVSYRNCLFQNSGSGVTLLSANDYNNNFTGCEFQDNTIAINCTRGNVYVMDCHFARSRTLDIFLCSHAHSIRRCTSVGSAQFILVPGAGSGCAVTVEDCHVDGWTGSKGAVVFGMRGPDTLFDCSFTHPPDTKAPIRLTNSPACRQFVVLSENTAPSSPTFVDIGPNSQIDQIPSGSRGPNLSDPNRSFLNSVETVPAHTFDVKRDFGAKGDRNHDDTAAITSALAAGRARGGNSIVYFPEGIYEVSGPLPITGSNYTVEGCGCQTRIDWRGAHGGAVFTVQDPQAVGLKNLLISAPSDTACILQTSAGASSSHMDYEGVSVSGTILGAGSVLGPTGHITSSIIERGLECVGLPSSTTVQLDDFVGSTHFTDCSRAVILGGFTTGGVLQVDGAHFDKSGFLGVQAHNDCANMCDVFVRDNQDFVGTNFYTEQTEAALTVSGDGALLGQPGHVTIQGSKTQTYDPTFLTVDNYEGRVAYMGAGLYSSLEPPVEQTGMRPVDILLIGDSFCGSDPHFSFDPSASLTAIGNFAVNPVNSDTYVLPDCLPDVSLAGSASLLTGTGGNNQAAFAPASSALDDFRLLGSVDLALNYPK